MSSRDKYKAANTASTPIKRCSLPSIPTISTIEATSSQKIRNEALNHGGSSSSSELRVSKDLAGDTRSATLQRSCVTQTPDERKKNEKRLERKERKRKVRRRIENSSSSDERNWHTTREITLASGDANHDKLAVSDRVVARKNAKETEFVADENSDWENDAVYRWERLPETIRDAPRVDDDVERFYGEPLVPRKRDPDAVKSRGIRSEDSQCVDTEDDDTLIVNEHAKTYPAPCHSRKHGVIGENYWGKPIRHVRNRELMLEIRREDKEREKKTTSRKRKGSNCESVKSQKAGSSLPKTVYDCISPIPVKDEELETYYGRCGGSRMKVYDPFFSPIPESDDEVFVWEGKRFLRKIPEPNFSRQPRFYDKFDRRTDDERLPSVAFQRPLTRQRRTENENNSQQRAISRIRLNDSKSSDSDESRRRVVRDAILESRKKTSKSSDTKKLSKIRKFIRNNDNLKIINANDSSSFDSSIDDKRKEAHRAETIIRNSYKSLLANLSEIGDGSKSSSKRSSKDDETVVRKRRRITRYVSSDSSRFERDEKTTIFENHESPDESRVTKTCPKSSQVMLNRIIEESSIDTNRTSVNEKRKIFKDSTRNVSSFNPPSSGNTSREIVRSMERSYRGFVRKISSDRWQVDLPKDIEEL